MQGRDAALRNVCLQAKELLTDYASTASREQHLLSALQEYLNATSAGPRELAGNDREKEGDAAVQKASDSNTDEYLQIAYYRPQRHLRQASIVAQKAALLFVDTQNYNAHPQGALYRDQAANPPDLKYYWQRMEQLRPNWTALRAGCKAAGVEVIYTIIASLTRDGRERGLDYKITGFHVPAGSWDAAVIDCIAPLGDEMVIPKTSASCFMSTNIDYVLRGLGVQQLLVAGLVTDQCIESTVRDACDLNYLVTLVTDCCGTYSQERHDNSLKAVGGFCRQRTCSEILEELQLCEVK